MITYTHNTNLVLAAIVVSIVAAITGLALMNNIRTLPESRRKAVIVMASFLLGGGIWSMHFLAMLSMQFTVPIHYDLLQTLGSGLIAVLVVGFALLLLHFRQRTPSILNIAGLCLGGGIVSMHVLGMSGMRGVFPVFNMVALVIAAILAALMGIAAIRVSYGSRSRVNIIKGGVMFGLAVVVVHYTAMIGTHFSLDPNYRALSITLDQGTLAIAVTVTGFVICGTFLLAASTFVPSVENSTEQTGERASTEATRPAMKLADSAAMDKDWALKSMQPEPVSPETSVNGSITLAPEHTLESSSNKSDVAHRRTDEVEVSQGMQASHSTASEQQDSQDAASGPMNSPITVKVPYEQQKQIFFVDSHDVGALRADGRYTQLYTRDGVKFCPWSITEAEKRLAGARFYRSHRSYLINLTVVAGFEKNRDSGVCHFEGFTHLTNVPVSRARVNELILELGLQSELGSLSVLATKRHS